MDIYKTSLKGTIKVLESEIDKEQRVLNEKIEALNALKKLLPDNIQFSGETSYLENADTQIMSLFEKGTIKRAIRRSELQQLFESEYNTKKNVGAGLPKLKKSGKLIMVRYNGQKGNSFWGLPEWIENDQFRNEFKPERKYLPENITKFEIIND